MSSIVSSNLLANLLNDYKSSLSSSSSSSSSVSNLISSDDTATSSSNNSYILDLSQAAQDILNSQNNSGTQSTISLTDSQTQKLQSILDKYKDAPVNNDTLSALNSDLQKAGLTPDELAAIQQAKAYNPIKSLLEILFTNSSDTNYNANDTLSSLSSASSSSPIGELLQQNLSNAETLGLQSTNSSSS